ncbi:MAG: hypothetical protein EOP09_16420, partial [Proteobacteria bacterium]
MFRIRLWPLLTLIFILSSHTSFAESWGEAQDPAQFLFADEQLHYQFDSLPLSARVDEAGGHLPYSDSYWPSNQGGINRRIFRQNDEPFSRHLHSEAEVRAMTENDRRSLSLTEKYDISQGDYNYTLTKRVMKLVSPSAPHWEGLCHG